MRLILYVISAVSLCSLVASLVAIAFVISLAQTRIAGPESDNLGRNAQAEISDCVGRALRQTKRDAVDVSLSDYEKVSEFCGHETYALEKLVAIDVSTETFHRQMFDTRLILFMVVVITLSGVGLATVQLLASYKLASAGHGEAFGAQSEISLERNKVSLKSSVTGLIILVVSLAFFIVYVKWVYPITPVNMDSSPSQQTMTPLANPVQGQYAPAVSKSMSVVDHGTSLAKTAQSTAKMGSSTMLQPPDSPGREKNTESNNKK